MVSYLPHGGGGGYTHGAVWVYRRQAGSERGSQGAHRARAHARRRGGKGPAAPAHRTHAAARGRPAGGNERGVIAFCARAHALAVRLSASACSWSMPAPVSACAAAMRRCAAAVAPPAEGALPPKAAARARGCWRGGGGKMRAWRGVFAVAARSASACTSPQQPPEKRKRTAALALGQHVARAREQRREARGRAAHGRGIVQQRPALRRERARQRLERRRVACGGGAARRRGARASAGREWAAGRAPLSLSHARRLPPGRKGGSPVDTTPPPPTPPPPRARTRGREVCVELLQPLAQAAARGLGLRVYVGGGGGGSGGGGAAAG